jgi:hypothetical protein
MRERGGAEPTWESVLDLLVYAPIGFATEFSARYPEYAARGRSTVAAQVGTARFIGELAVRQATTQLKKWTQRPAADEAPGDSPAATDISASAPARSGGDGGAHLPLADYDTLAAAQIVPRLEGLSVSELEEVRIYELAHRARKTVLGKIAQLNVN